jgi:biofilm PGA synthesis N-glycosyltransferase PgaC
MAYVTIKVKFVICLTMAFTWMAVSIWLSLPWYEDLSREIGWLLAIFLISFIAIVPGFMNAFVICSLLLDKRPEILREQHYPPITILIAAYNEAADIATTLKSIFLEDYPNTVHVIVINDGSKDETVNIVRSFMSEHQNLSLIDLNQNGGKANALNDGLEQCSTDIVITIDADSYLWKDALRNLVGRYLSDPANTKAVAGEILIRNSRENWITKAQEWDYFLGIASVKRIQSLFQGTLVAQGAFSLYDRKTLVELGGWPNKVGEDIVLTWKILMAGYRVGHAENACAFTNCPNTFMKFVNQRRRWSRGLIESFKENWSILFKKRQSTMYIWWNTLFPLIDVAYTVGFIPGLVLACFGIYWIVGPMTIALIPMAFILNIVMYNRGKAMFVHEHLSIRKNYLGFIFYVLAYGIVLQPACVWGYLSEIFNLRKHWGTK